SEISQIRDMLDHLLWAETRVFQALRDATDAEPSWREFAHVIGAQAVWLGRLQGRKPRAAVWPSISPSELEPLMADVQRGYVELLDNMDDTTLHDSVHYVNSAGDSFTSVARDILLHVLLHSQ